MKFSKFSFLRFSKYLWKERKKESKKINPFSFLKIPKDSSVDFDVLSASSLDVLTKMGVELQKNESASEEQALATSSTPEPIPEVDNDDDSNWLSYFDCNAIFDVTYENQSYYNSTKAEKDSDSDLDDTLTFDDAEEGEALVLDENDTYPNSYQQSFEETCEKKLDNNNFVVSDKASTLEINQDSRSVAENIDPNADQGAKEGEEKDRNGDNLEADSTDRIDDNANANETSARIESMTIEKIEEVSSREDDSNEAVAKETIIELKKTEGKMDDFSSDSEDEYEGNLIYSSPNVNISAYFKYRDSMKEPKYEATIDQLNAMYSKESSKSVILEEIVEEPCAEEAGKNPNETANETNEGECLKVQEELKQGQEEAKEEQEELKKGQKEEEEANLTGSAIIPPDQRKESKFVELNSPEEYLEKLAEITEPDCPRTEEEAHEKLKKIAEGKAEIENRKNEALEDLSVEFDKIEKLVAETKSANQVYDESGSDESSDEAKEGDIDVGKDIELPLTKDQVAESFKFKTVQKSVEEEEKRRAELLQECLQVIPKIPETEESVDEDLVAIGGVERRDVAREKVEGDDDEDTGASEASKEQEKEGEGEEGANEAIVDEASTTTEIKSTVQGIVQDIIDETEDSLFWRFKKEPERTYIKGKVYDFDEKKHGARYSCLEPVRSVDAFTSACT